MKKILIIRYSSMGDVLLCTPAVRCLRKAYGQAEIHFAVRQRFAPLLEHNPCLNRLQIWQEGERFADFQRRLKSERYDAALDLQASQRSRWMCFVLRIPDVVTTRKYYLKRLLLVALHLNLYRDAVAVPLRHLKAAAELGAEDDGKGLDIFITAQDQEGAWRMTADLGQNILALAPGARWATKRWNEKAYARVAALWTKQQPGGQVAWLGNATERELCEHCRQLAGGCGLNMAGQLTIGECAAVLQRCRCLVCNDSGLMHLAAAGQTPLVALFGPTTEELGFFPFRARAKVIERDLKCRPCTFKGNIACPIETHECLRLITPEEVMAAAERVITTG